MTRSIEKSFKISAMKSVYILMAFFTICLMSCATRTGWEYNNPYSSCSSIYFESYSTIWNSSISSSTMEIKKFEQGHLTGHVEIETSYNNAGQITSLFEKDNLTKSKKNKTSETHFYYSNTGELEKEINLESTGDTLSYTIYRYDAIARIETRDYYGWSYSTKEDSTYFGYKWSYYTYKNINLLDSVDYFFDEYGLTPLARMYYDTNKQLIYTKSYDWHDTSISEVSYHYPIDEHPIDELLKTIVKNKNEKIAKQIDQNDNTFTYKILRCCRLRLTNHTLLIPEGKLVIELNNLRLFSSIIAYDKKGNMTAGVTRTFQFN